MDCRVLCVLCIWHILSERIQLLIFSEDLSKRQYQSYPSQFYFNHTAKGDTEAVNYGKHVVRYEKIMDQKCDCCRISISV